MKIVAFVASLLATLVHSFCGERITRQPQSIAIGVSGDEQGYLDPCGCAPGQPGGMPRRATLIRRVRTERGNLLLIHNGGFVNSPGWQQQIKFVTALHAMSEMGYAALNLGVGEVSLGLPTLQSAEKGGITFLWANVHWNRQALFPASLVRRVGKERVGIAWRMLPHEFLPWETVYYYFNRWRRTGVWERMNRVLREVCRRRDGREPTSRAAILDSQTVKTTEIGGSWLRRRQEDDRA